MNIDTQDVKAEGQQTNRKEGQNWQSKKVIEKQQIISTELPEGGNTISTKEPPTSQQQETTYR